MNFNEYQKKAKRTALYPKIGKSFVYPALGLAGEAGEVAEKVKKIFRDKKGKVDGETKDILKKELGDVLWYLAQLSTEFGLEFEDVAEENINKLWSRKRRDKLHGDGDNR